jgi:hypothetical protein
MIQLPSLLTIFSEQKPLKSNEHGKKNRILCPGEFSIASKTASSKAGVWSSRGRPPFT